MWTVVGNQLPFIMKSNGFHIEFKGTTPIKTHARQR